MCAPVPANGFRLVFANASTELVTESDTAQCKRISLGGSTLATAAALQRSLEQRPCHRSTCRLGCSAPNQGSALQPADTTQPLGRNPAQRLLHHTHATRRTRTARICCPSLRSHAPTSTIASYLSCIHSLTCSTQPSHLDSGGSPSERPPPPTQTLHCDTRHHLLCHRAVCKPCVRARANGRGQWLAAVAVLQLRIALPPANACA